MDPPYVVASLPKPLDSQKGKLQAAAVHSFRGLKKRKRHEVVVGVDGESVNLYNIQSQSLVASYAIPPQTYLCCPPASIYVRRSGTSPPERHTFAALSDGHAGSNPRLVRFVESLGDSAAFAAPVKSEVRLQGKPFALEALPGAVESLQHPPQVLASYPDGNVECIGSSLVDWAYTSDRKTKAHVESLTAFDSDAAKKGLLKGREDVLSAIEATGAETAMQLCRVVRNDKELSLQIFRLRTAGLGQADGTFSGMDLLDTIKLPQSGLDDSLEAVCEVNATSGHVYRLAGGKLSIWNLTDFIPHLQTVIGQDSEPIASYTRTSAAFVLTATSKVSRLYDVKYGSVQGACNRRQLPDSATSKKRKRTSDPLDTKTCSLVSSFSDIGLAVAVDHDELIAFQLVREARDAKRFKAVTASLIDAVGKSECATSPQSSLKSDWTSKVDELVAQGDAQALEQFIDQDLHLQYRHGDTVNGSSGPHQELWELDAECFDPAYFDRQKALYLLGRLFRVETTTQPATSVTIALKLQVRARNIARWLALSGVLSAQHLSTAMDVPIGPGNVAKALVLADDSFELLQDIISLPIFFPLEEVTEALKLLIESLDTRSTDIALLALPAPAQPGDPNSAPPNEADSTIESESRAAEKELGHAFSALQTGLDIRSTCFRLLFARLRAFPARAVKDTFRQRLSHRNLVFFVQMLRVELAEGGWTSRYIDVGNDEYANRIEASEKQTRDVAGEQKGPSDQALRHIGQLLTCAIDAIGMNGWLVGLSGDSELTQDILDSIRAEVSASLEGCLEAQTLERFLSGLERYADELEGADKVLRRKVKGDEGGSMPLPIGCRVEAPKVREGGKREGPKSRLEIAREKDRRVGKYEVDRIRV